MITLFSGWVKFAEYYPELWSIIIMQVAQRW